MLFCGPTSEQSAKASLSRPFPKYQSYSRHVLFGSMARLVNQTAKAILLSGSDNDNNRLSKTIISAC